MVSIIKNYFLFLSVLLSMPAWGYIAFNHNNLCTIMQQYQTINYTWHAGDLFEHTMWVTYAMEKWFHKHKFWVEGLNQEDIRLAIACAFLHDIGKAGDLEFVYKTKPSHPQDGFEYLLNKRPFLIDKQTTYNFDEWFHANNFSPEEKKIIAIAAGIHWDFGLALRKIIDQQEDEILIFEEFLNTLKLLTIKAEFNNGIITKQLLLLSILINAADVKGMHYVVPSNKTTIEMPIYCEKYVVTNNAYSIHGHKRYGKEVREKLINYFDTYYSKENK